MLDALARKKDRGYLTDLAERDTRLCEDEITSTVFGSLRYLSSEGVWDWVQHLLGVSAFDSDLIPHTHTVEFWPRWSCEQSRVEPDMLLRFEGSAGSFAVCFEMKWGAPQDQEQLDRQRKAMLRHVDVPPQHQRQIYIAKTRQPYSDVACVSWGDVARLMPEDPQMRCWAELAKHALLRLGQPTVVPKFSGFHSMVSEHELACATSLSWKQLLKLRADFTVQISHACFESTFAWRFPAA